MAVWIRRLGTGSSRIDRNVGALPPAQGKQSNRKGLFGADRTTGSHRVNRKFVPRRPISFRPPKRAKRSSLFLTPSIGATPNSAGGRRPLRSDPQTSIPEERTRDAVRRPLPRPAHPVRRGRHPRMPFEVWKTRMGRFRQEGTLEAFANIYKQGGVKAFWAGTGPKMIESGSKVRHER